MLIEINDVHPAKVCEMSLMDDFLDMETLLSDVQFKKVAVMVVTELGTDIDTNDLQPSNDLCMFVTEFGIKTLWSDVQCLNAALILVTEFGIMTSVSDVQ